MTFIQRRSNVSDVGPTLYKCYTIIVLCLLGIRKLLIWLRVRHVTFPNSSVGIAGPRLPGFGTDVCDWVKAETNT